MWKNLQLNDKPTIDNALRKNGVILSDYCFTNLWMWNRLRNYQILKANGLVFLKYYQEGQEFYLYPIGDGDRNRLISKMIKPPFTMRAIPEQNFLDYPLTEEKNRNDYIYSFDDLLHLSGNQYQSKRNLIHQFEDNYDFLYQKIEVSLIPKIKEMEKRWYINHKDKSTSADNEHMAALEGLKYFEELKLEGGAIIVDDQVIAYSLSEYLSKDMVVIHVERAFSEYKGSYQMINQQLLMHIKPVLFINREEDLGFAHLKKMKHSYHPIRLEKKFYFTVF